MGIELQLANLISSILVASIPVCYGWFIKYSNRKRPSHIISKIREYESAKELLESRSSTNVNESVYRVLGEVISDLEQEIEDYTSASNGYSAKTQLGVRMFLYLLALEVLLVFGIMAGFGYFDRVLVLFVGPSWETKVYFLEGIFKYPASRSILFGVLFSTSLLVTVRFKAALFNPLKSRLQSGYSKALILLASFNLVFGVVLTAAMLILALMDPYTVLF